MEPLIYGLCRRGRQDLAQFLQRSGLHGLDGAEPLPQRLLTHLAYAGNAVQLAAVGARVVFLPLESDGKAVHLLLYAADEGEDVG